MPVAAEARWRRHGTASAWADLTLPPPHRATSPAPPPCRRPPRQGPARGRLGRLSSTLRQRQRRWLWRVSRILIARYAPRRSRHLSRAAMITPPTPGLLAPGRPERQRLLPAFRPLHSRGVQSMRRASGRLAAISPVDTRHQLPHRAWSHPGQSTRGSSPPAPPRHCRCTRQQRRL